MPAHYSGRYREWRHTLAWTGCARIHRGYTRRKPRFRKRTSILFSITLAARKHCRPLNGISAPLLIIGAAKLIVQLPYEIQPGDATATVEVEGATTAPVDFVIAAIAPGIFGVLNGDGTPNSPRNPTPGGAEVSIYFTGAGFTEPLVPTGALAIGYHPPIATVLATIAGMDAQVTWSSLVPGFAGLAQANIRTPRLGDGDWPLLLLVGDIASPPAMVSISFP